MEQICVSGVERDTIRPHPAIEGAVLVSARLVPTPDNMWRARFSQSLLQSPDFGRIELGRDGSSVDITVGRDEQVTERLDRLTELVAQTNAEVAEERRRLGAAEQRKQQQQDSDLARVLRDVDAMDE
jgi:hypothetical protein